MIGKGHLGNLGDGGNLLDLDIHVSKLRVIYFRADYFMVHKLYLRSKPNKATKISFIFESYNGSLFSIN